MARDTLSLLGLPSGWPGAASLGTTQSSTQDLVAQPGNPAHPSAQMSAVMTESLDTQRLPSQPAHNRLPLGAQSQPSQTTTNTHPTPADPSRTLAHNNPTSTQKKATHSLRGRGVMGAVSGSSAELLEFIQNSGELARALRELHRRQKVAVASGVALKDVGPMGSQSVQLERDLVPDNEKERTAQAARASGELPFGRKPKLASCDLHGYERQLISPAKLRLFAYALKKGIIQTRPTFFEWTDKAWLKIWKEQLPDLPPEVASTAIKQI
ncbi:hypothetical protein FRC10_004635, partial [Ceratobasidium sp. 414]